LQRLGLKLETFCAVAHRRQLKKRSEKVIAFLEKHFDWMTTFLQH